MATALKLQEGGRLRIPMSNGAIVMTSNDFSPVLTSAGAGLKPPCVLH